MNDDQPTKQVNEPKRNEPIMPMTQLIRPNTFLEPASVTLATLFGSSNFKIPDYQRDYSWTDEEIRDLWDDLAATASKSFDQAGNLVNNPMPHFLGAIVLQTFPENRTPEVMDGQQRLVTLSALFSVLWEFAEQLTQPTEKDSWTRTLEQLLFTFISGSKLPKINLARDDHHYQQLICNKLRQAERLAYLAVTPAPKNSVLSRLKVCIELFHSKVTTYAGPVGGAGRDSKLIQFFKTALELTVVLQMKVMEQGVAYEVFESLNARGLDLQQADLLKNKLYALAEQQGTKADVVRAWDRIVKALEQQSMVSLTEFFHFHLVARFRDAKQSDLYKQVLNHLNRNNPAKAYAEDAARAAESIQQILEAGASFTPAVARDVESIRDLITNKYALTLLISAVSKYAPTSTEMGEVIKLTHHYVFRRFLVEDLRVGTYASEITSIARDFAANVIADVDGLKTKLQTCSNTAVFKTKLAEFVAPSNKVGFYVLEMIENHISNNAGTIVQRQSISQHLEHIMPRRPNAADWSHVLNDPAYDEYVNRIGNLLVLEANINSHVKNKAFAFKNQNPGNLDYQHSGMALPRIAVNSCVNGMWTFESIRTRQRNLVDAYAEDVWSLA